MLVCCNSLQIFFLSFTNRTITTLKRPATRFVFQYAWNSPSLFTKNLRKMIFHDKTCWLSVPSSYYMLPVSIIRHSVRFYPVRLWRACLAVIDKSEHSPYCETVSMLTSVHRRASDYLAYRPTFMSRWLPIHLKIRQWCCCRPTASAAYKV